MDREDPIVTAMIDWWLGLGGPVRAVIVVTLSSIVILGVLRWLDGP